jgi:glycine cleavage system H lipoate-binding protein
MPDILDDLRYSKGDLWARPGAGARVVRVGVTDFAQQSLGGVIGVTLPGPGDTLQAGEACSDIESVNDGFEHPELVSMRFPSKCTRLPGRFPGW